MSIIKRLKSLIECTNEKARKISHENKLDAEAVLLNSLQERGIERCIG